MDKLEVLGAKKLTGKIYVSGSKNAALPILAATILSKKKIVLRNVPKVKDIETMPKLLQSIWLDVKYLKKKGFNPILTREPGGTRSAESIRRLILKDYFNKGNNEKFDKYTDTLLYLAARNEHIINKIKPALKKKELLSAIDL